MGRPKLTTDQFIKQIEIIHSNEYDYSKTDYINAHTKICIICLEHGEFWQTPNSHKRGKGCPKCGIISNRLTTDEFIHRAINIHCDKYDYSKVDYINTHIKICIICKDHGVFWQKPTDHLRGQGCPYCNSSHGERNVHRWLTDHDIKHEVEYSYDGLVGMGGGLLRYDFFLPGTNTCVEFDGDQHTDPYHYLNSMGYGYDKRCEHDIRKNEYCEKYNIRLIRIHEDDDINDVLSKYIKSQLH